MTAHRLAAEYDTGAILGRRAIAGSALYCGVKAGMDHFSRAVALDEAHREASGGPAAARIVSLAPGNAASSLLLARQHSTGALLQAKQAAHAPWWFPDGTCGTWEPLWNF